MSQQVFDNLREQLILQASEALKPLVAFLELHECDDDDILEAIFEAIAYDKNAELELGVLAFDKRRDWMGTASDGEVDQAAELMYRLGLDLHSQFKRHRLYYHGFLPYQFIKRHGRDLVVNRLGIPEIMNREQREMVGEDLVARATSNPMVWKPKLTKRVTPQGQVFYFADEPRKSTAEDVLGPIARAFQNFYTATDPKVSAPLSEADAVDKFQQEMEAIYGKLKKVAKPKGSVQDEAAS
jgi:hypothetical protein